ncbi:MAG TPA: protein kinase, partial [Candidatus Sulfomarinibacteraceae bacterium]|nr:protein kinase [Candidatus Sulfomarinibacteraceae bacterium]
MIGTTLAHYRVTAALGEGGMGEVWRAEDEKLGREVALKVLPESFAQDPERLARFEREARVLASLNHPNIAHLYGLETAGAIPSDGRENSEFGIRNSELPATVSPDEGSGLEARGSSTSSHPAAGTAAPQSGPAPPDGLVGHASGVPGGVGGNSKLKTQNSKLTADAAASEVTFLVMELVEGEDLSERIRRGPIPVEEAVAIALQIAEALEAAHERGIVHRDLKPANIKLRPDGTVKVLDFGLAKAWEAEGPDPGLSLSPTVTKHATAAGLILGTAAYMSPEQARGTGVDRRADVWSFGVVLWEMLTGRKLFEGHTVSDVLASVLKEAPDLEALPAEVPPKLRALLARCLEKDPRRRLQAIGEARIALELPLSEAAPVAAEAADGGQTRRSRIAAAVGWALAAVGLGAAALLLWQQLGRSPERVLRTSIPPPEATTFHLSGINAGPAALSPDGTRIVFSARDEDGAVRLYLRVLDQPEARVLSGTETAQYPF